MTVVSAQQEESLPGAGRAGGLGEPEGLPSTVKHALGGKAARRSASLSTRRAGMELHVHV
jgi:hypothetical protein